MALVAPLVSRRQPTNEMVETVEKADKETETNTETRDNSGDNGTPHRLG